MKTDFLNPDNWALTLHIIDEFRASPGDQITRDGRIWTVLRASYIGDGLYATTLADHYKFDLISFEGSIQ